MKKQLKVLSWLGLVFFLVGVLTACGDAVNPSPTIIAARPTVTVPTSPASASVGMPGVGMGMVTPGNDPMSMMLKPLDGPAFEQTWLQLMIVHHQGALQMANLVKTNTQRAELLKLADDINSTQTTEINQMTSWLKEWHNAMPLSSGAMGGMNPSTSSGTSMGMGMADMGKLPTAKDAEFDKLFVAMMIEHHQQAVSMSAFLPEKTKRAELLKLGQAIITAQTKEIEQMLSWQKTWAK